MSQSVDLSNCRVHRSGNSYATNESHHRKPRWVIRVPYHIAREIDGNRPFTENMGWGDMSGKVTFDSRKIWQCMTKEMVIKAIESQIPEMRINTKLRKLTLITQWLDNGGDPNVWEPLLVRHRVYCNKTWSS